RDHEHARQEQPFAKDFHDPAPQPRIGTHDGRNHADGNEIGARAWQTLTEMRIVAIFSVGRRIAGVNAGRPVYSASLFSGEAIGTGPIHRNAGAVAIVVARAMSTIIANSVGELTFRSRPMLSTISSISPRVFIKIPKADE